MSLASIDETLLQENTVRAFRELRFEDAVRLIEPLAWSRADSEHYNNLGALYFQLGWAREAEAAFRRALELNPTHPDAITNLADQFLHYGLPFSALRVLRDAQAAGAPDALCQSGIRSLEDRFPARRISVALQSVRFDQTLRTRGDATALAQLERFLQSLERQSYPLHELLIQEGSSLHLLLRDLCERGAAGASNLDRLLPLVRPIYHLELPDRATFGNQALKRCSGEYLALLETDLSLDPVWLERAMAHMEGPRVGAVGVRVHSHHLASLAERWALGILPRPSGDRGLEDPGTVGEVGGVFRVSALKRAGGWGARWATIGEELQRAMRLREVGFSLQYEPGACLELTQARSLPEILRESWRICCIDRIDQRRYDRLSAMVDCLESNARLALGSLSGRLHAQQTDALYFSFLQYYAFMFFDLERVLQRGQSTAEAVSQTTLALLLLIRQQLRGAYVVSGAVSEQTLQDLEPLALPMLLEEELERWHSEGWREQALPGDLTVLEAQVHRVRSQLQQAEAELLTRFVQVDFLGGLGAGLGALLERSVQRVREDAQTPAAAGTTRCVLFNPPPRNRTPEPWLEPQAHARWMHPMRIQEAAEHYTRQYGAVLQVDAVEERLDLQAAESRVLGLHPGVVVYSALEGGLERCAAMARRLKLVGPRGLRQILVHAGAAAEPSVRRCYPMFDEVYGDLPGRGKASGAATDQA